MNGVALFMCSVPLVVIPSARQAEGHSLLRIQKPLLHKLLSSFNLRELYLFIICSQAVLLWQGIVRRGNLSFPAPPLSLAFPAKLLLCLVFYIVPLRRETDRVVYSVLRRIICCLCGRSPKMYLNQYFFKGSIESNYCMQKHCSCS